MTKREKERLSMILVEVVKAQFVMQPGSEYLANPEVEVSTMMPKQCLALMGKSHGIMEEVSDLTGIEMQSLLSNLETGAALLKEGVDKATRGQWIVNLDDPDPALVFKGKMEMVSRAFARRIK